MKAVILAAGRGVRMGDLTSVTPKPLLTVGDKTLLEYKMDALPAECTEIILVVGYLAEKIRNFFGSEYKGKKVTYVECEPLGTGYALWQAKEHLDGVFVVMCGDDLYAPDDIAECARRPFSALVFRSEKKSSGGQIILDDKGQIAEIVEGSHELGSVIATGLYALTPEIFTLPLVKIHNGTEYGLPQTLMQLNAISGGRRIKAVFTTKWHQVSSPQDLLLDKEKIKAFL